MKRTQHKALLVISSVTAGLWLLALTLIILFSTAPRAILVIAHMLTPFAFFQGNFGLLYGNRNAEIILCALNSVGPVLLAIGAIIFSGKKHGGVNLLRMVWMLIFFANVIKLPLEIHEFLYRYRGPVEIVERIPWWSYALTFARTGAWLLLSAFMVHRLALYQTTKRFFYARGDYSEQQLVQANRWFRLLNYILDYTIITAFIHNYHEYLYYFLPHLPGRPTGLSWRALLYYVVVSFIYYFLNEVLWSTTPGKSITFCTVTDEEGRKVNFGRILARTLARYIPFDIVSFLGGRGWHDAIGDTYVYRVTNNHLKTEIEQEVEAIGNEEAPVKLPL